MTERPPQSGPAQLPAGEGLRLNVTSDPANLGPVRRACEAFCLECGLSEAAAGEVGLCVNEAMANVTRHAYRGAADRPVLVTGEFDGQSVRIALRDWGTGVNPTTLPRPPRDPLCPGGLGLICMGQLMDEIAYAPQPDGMLLTMTKGKKKCRVLSAE